MEIIFPIILVIAGIAIFSNSYLRRKKFAAMTVVKSGVEYPNNLHVIGVGYYHAASRRWFPNPWNEFREGRGYYWDGAWHHQPDQQMVLKSVPSESEVYRVNQAWRDADPDQAQRFWNTVEHQGFGTAIRRSEGS